jgi:hypothetical protein
MPSLNANNIVISKELFHATQCNNMITAARMGGIADLQPPQKRFRIAEKCFGKAHVFELVVCDS